MIRLFKHYIPHAVILLGLFDLLLLVVAGELLWQLRASQIGMEPGVFSETARNRIMGAGVVLWHEGAR